VIVLVQEGGDRERVRESGLWSLSARTLVLKVSATLDHANAKRDYLTNAKRDYYLYENT
jgi:hypothetical protein